jgi:hypothetical protein
MMKVMQVTGVSIHSRAEGNSGRPPVIGRRLHDDDVHTDNGVINAA